MLRIADRDDVNCDSRGGLMVSRYSRAASLTSTGPSDTLCFGIGEERRASSSPSENSGAKQCGAKQSVRVFLIGQRRQRKRQRRGRTESASHRGVSLSVQKPGGDFGPQFSPTHQSTQCVRHFCCLPACLPAVQYSTGIARARPSRSADPRMPYT